jgi:hypothetical protein
MVPTQEDYERLLMPVEETFNRLAQLSQKGPAPDSKAAHDRQTELGHKAWVLALSASVVAVDHLVAWKALRLDCRVQPTFAHFTLIRSAIEGMVVTRWLCDPRIDASARMQRAAGAQIRDYEERRRFEEYDRVGPKAEPGESRTAAERMQEFTRLLEKEHVRAETMPPATRLFALYVPSIQTDRSPGEGLLRVLSGSTHAKIWSLAAMSERGEVIKHDDGGLSVRITADDERTYKVTAIAMTVARATLADLTTYAGIAE